MGSFRVGPLAAEAASALPKWLPRPPADVRVNQRRTKLSKESQPKSLKDQRTNQYSKVYKRPMPKVDGKLSAKAAMTLRITHHRTTSSCNGRTRRNRSAMSKISSSKVINIYHLRKAK